MKKFKESLKTAVFTTKFIADKLSPIVYVSHDDDGSWQFQGPEDNVSDEDIRLLGLGEIIEIDNTILEISDMPNGSIAIRDNSVSHWKVISSK